MTALVSPAHVAAHPGDLDQAMPPGLVAVGVPDTRPTARRPELHASEQDCSNQGNTNEVVYRWTNRLRPCWCSELYGAGSQLPCSARSGTTLPIGPRVRETRCQIR